jgi:hypothetical protein
MVLQTVLVMSIFSLLVPRTGMLTYSSPSTVLDKPLRVLNCNSLDDVQHIARCLQRTVPIMLTVSNRLPSFLTASRLWGPTWIAGHRGEDFSRHRHPHGDQSATRSLFEAISPSKTEIRVARRMPTRLLHCLLTALADRNALGDGLACLRWVHAAPHIHPAITEDAFVILFTRALNSNAKEAIWPAFRFMHELNINVTRVLLLSLRSWLHHSNALEATAVAHAYKQFSSWSLFESVYLVMNWSDLNDTKRTMVLQTVLVMNMFSSLVPRTRMLT